MGCITKRPATWGNFSSWSFARNVHKEDKRSDIGYCSLILAAPSSLTVSHPLTTEDIERVDALQLDWISTTGGQETGFGIERSVDGITFVEIDTVGTGVLTYTNDSLTYNDTWFYRVRALGINPSGYSNIDSGTVSVNPLLYVSNESFWFESDRVLFNGSLVSSITDLTGNRGSLTNPISSNQPYHNLKTPNADSSIDGHNAIYYFRTGTEFRWLENDAASFGAELNQPVDFFVVFGKNGTGISNVIADNSIDVISKATTNMFIGAYELSGQFASDFSGSVNRSLGSVFGDLPNNTISLISGRMDYEQKKIWVWLNGVLIRTANLDLTGLTAKNITSLIIGAGFGDRNTLKFFESFAAPRDADKFRDTHQYFMNEYPSIGIVLPKDFENGLETIVNDTVGEVTLYWAMTTDGDINSYSVQRSTDNITFAQIGVADQGAYNDTSVSSSTLYYYKIQEIGTSPDRFSNTQSATTL